MGISCAPVFCFVLCTHHHLHKIKAWLKNISLESVWPLLDDGMCQLLKLLFWGGGVVAVRREYLLVWKLSLLGCNAMLNHNLAFPSLSPCLPSHHSVTNYIRDHLHFTALHFTCFNPPIPSQLHHFSIPVAHLDIYVSFTCGRTSCFNTTTPIGLLTQMYWPA